jgi:ATP-binding cassette subfamily G (WHITE) protein 2 (SNQ2)
MGTVFLRTPESTSAYFSRGGVLFLYVSFGLCSIIFLTSCFHTSAILFSALSTLAEIPALYSQRPIILRHKKAALYHPFVEALAMTLVDVPITFVTLITFSLILYFMVRLQQTAVSFMSTL